MSQISKVIFWVGICCLIIGFGFHWIYFYDHDLRAGFIRSEVRRSFIIGCVIVVVGLILLVFSFFL